ncbi:hypothetical protein, partial [Kribbia dieselivorans]|uniref:hypothetical protein n=1 Tax=Kribbia dieselivorans TaxID=331526 RepID=UPI0014700D69
AAAREIGAAVHASALIAVVAAVPGVVGVDLDRLYLSGHPPTAEPRLVPEPASVSATGAPIGAQLLALAPDPLDTLVELT